MLETLVHVLIGLYIGWMWKKPAVWAKVDAPVMNAVAWAWNKLKGLVK